MKASIIIRSKNEKMDRLMLIDGLQADISNFEVILVDNNSTDKTIQS